MAVLDRNIVLVVVLAAAGAGAGMLAGGLLRPEAPLPPVRAGLPTLEVGTPAPALELPDLDGGTRRLADWQGKLVLVNFWASWCAPCRREMPILDRARTQHAAQGLEVIGVAADEPGPTRDFLAEFPVGYPVLIDDPARGEDASIRFGNNRNVLPYTVLIGRDGRVLASHFGDFSESALAEWLAPHLD